MDLVERDIFIKFLEGAATAQNLTEVNISAGIALQELGVTPPDIEGLDHAVFPLNGVTR